MTVFAVLNTNNSMVLEFDCSDFSFFFSHNKIDELEK